MSDTHDAIPAPVPAPWKRPAAGCGKRTYPNVDAARRAHRHAGYRLRTYYCRECRGIHITNQEKA